MNKREEQYTPCGHLKDRKRKKQIVSKSEYSLMQFAVVFKDRQICMDYLASIRWPDGICCPFCGCNKVYKIDNGRRYKCADRYCYKKFSSLTDTIFHQTKISLENWFFLFYLMAGTKKSISSHQIGRNLAITQKSAWWAMDKIRTLYQEDYPIKLSGVVEIDETFLGSQSKWARYCRISTSKTPILGMIERDGLVVVQAIPDREKDTVQQIIHQHIVYGSTVYTDGFYSYKSLSSNYKHEFIEHLEREYIRGEVHTNNIENFWRKLKTGIRNGHHFVSAKHVQRYIDELVYKHNTRHLTHLERFHDMLKRADNSTRKTIYNVLPQKEEDEKTSSIMKLPSFQFYPGDWRKDPDLSRASLKAKGALIEVLCLAFECEKRGVLKTGSTPWSIKEIARAMGGDSKENEEGIRELLELKVLKKDRKGAIFSSRMCKDEHLRKVRRDAGSKGGNPNLVNQNDNQTNNQNPTPSSSSSSSSSKINTEQGVFADSELNEKWKEWLQFRKEKRNSLTPTTAAKQIRFLNKYSPKVALEILEKSMEKGWTGLFEPEQSGKSISINQTKQMVH